MENTNIDWSKYKRFFTFGCSFTAYIYPTWADIIYKSMPTNVVFMNAGQSGAGNAFISSRITESNRKFKFCDTDLIAVMWTTYCRIDYYKSDRRWQTPGNIYTQNMLSESTVRELEDPNWFLMRDLSLIDLTTTYLEGLPCDVLQFMSVPLTYNYFQNLRLDKISTSIINTYSNLENKVPTNLFEFMGRRWSDKIRYLNDDGTDFIDYHPGPVDYANYLNSIKVPITSEAVEYAEESYRRISNGTRLTKERILDMFPEVEYYQGAANKSLW